MVVKAVPSQEKPGSYKIHRKCHQVTQDGEITLLVTNGNLCCHDSSHRNDAFLERSSIIFWYLKNDFS
jgi:hypothetical protein